MCSRTRNCPAFWKATGGAHVKSEDKWTQGTNQSQKSSNQLKPRSSEGRPGSFRKATAGRPQDDNDGDEGGGAAKGGGGGHESVPQSKTPPRHHGMTPDEQMKMVLMAHALRQAQPHPAMAPPAPAPQQPMGPPGMPPGMAR